MVRCRRCLSCGLVLSTELCRQGEGGVEGGNLVQQCPLCQYSLGRRLRNILSSHNRQDRTDTEGREDMDHIHTMGGKISRHKLNTLGRTSHCTGEGHRPAEVENQKHS